MHIQIAGNSVHLHVHIPVEYGIRMYIIVG